MKVVRFPIAGSITNRGTRPARESTIFDQQFVNCYPEITKNQISGRTSVALYKRPGYAKGAALSGVLNASFGIVAWTGNSGSTVPVAAAFNNNPASSTSVWDLTNDTKIGGDIASTNGCSILTETDVSGTATLIGNFFDSSTGALEQWYFPEGGSWTQVTDGDFPSNVVGRPAHMDGYVFNMTKDGKIYNSDLNSVSAYTAGNFVSANDYPDRGVSVAKHGNYIVGFGERSIQLFYNAGNASGSVLSRVQGGTIPLGAQRAATLPLTILPAFGTIYWMATSSDGSIIGIYRFGGNGIAPEKISSPAIDKLLASSSLLGFAGSMVLHGMRHVVMYGFQGLGTTEQWCYCIDTGAWWRFETTASKNINAIVATATDISTSIGVTYFITNANARGNSFSPASPVFQDDGSNYTMTVQTGNDDYGTAHRKAFRSLRLIGDKQSSTSNVAVSYSDDDYANFSTARNIDMSVYPSVALKNLQSSRRRAWKFTNTANTALRLEAAEIEYDVNDFS